MNKSCAPQARKDFITAVVARANLLGISEKNGKLEIASSKQKWRCHSHRRTSLAGQGP